MTDQDAPTYKNILDNMGDGVMTVDRDGRVTTLNPAACRLLEIERDGVLGRAFGEVFLAAKGLDDFSQAVLDAVYNEATALRRVVEVKIGETTRTLTLVTSYLQEARGDEVRRLGVIAVFSDITEVKELRESELRLAEALKKQHADLQDSYRQVEENNAALALALKQVRVARITATVFVVVLFAAAGVYSWNADVLSSTAEAPAPASEARAPADLPVATITRRPISSTISLAGRLEPLRTVAIASPISGNVAAIHFVYGEQVARGQLLIDLDTTEVRNEHRNAQIAHIKALERFNELRDWAHNPEVTRLRRSVRKAESELDILKSEAEEAAFLLERGIIPASERKAAERAYENQKLDTQAVGEDLRIVLAKGGAETMRVAQLELENAAARLGELEETLKSTVVHAPVAGVVLQPPPDRNGGRDTNAGEISVGRSVNQGELLVRIGDLEGLSVRGQVDEVDITKIRGDQTVRITGDAFPGTELSGKVVHVSSQSGDRERRQGGPPAFEVTAAVRGLTRAQREQLRLGMSADLEIVVYERPDALMAPLGAVEFRGGQSWVFVRDNDTGALRDVPVVPGVTTLNEVEILEGGLRAGDEVALVSGG